MNSTNDLNRKKSKYFSVFILNKESLSVINGIDFYVTLYKNIFLVQMGIGERRTASKYLKALEDVGVLESFKLGKEIFYVNKKLYRLLRK